MFFFAYYLECMSHQECRDAPLQLSQHGRRVGHLPLDLVKGPDLDRVLPARHEGRLEGR